MTDTEARFTTFRYRQIIKAKVLAKRSWRRLKVGFVIEVFGKSICWFAEKIAPLSNSMRNRAMGTKTVLRWESDWMAAPTERATLKPPIPGLTRD